VSVLWPISLDCVYAEFSVDTVTHVTVALLLLCQSATWTQLSLEHMAMYTTGTPWRMFGCNDTGTSCPARQPHYGVWAQGRLNV